MVVKLAEFENSLMISTLVDDSLSATTRSLVAMSERTGLSVSQVTDEVLYTGLIEMYEMEELDD